MAYKILVVDDNEDMVWVLSDWLEGLGFEVLSAASGDEALLQLGQYQVDLMISDYSMPGMSGEELLKRAKVLKPGLPAILATSLAGIPDSTRPFFSEDYFLAKPFDIEQLMDAILTLLRPAGAVKGLEKAELSKRAVGLN